MLADVKYGDKCYTINAYNTAQEKEALIYSMGAHNESTLDKILAIFNFPKNEISKLSLDEKLFLLYKYREISIGEVINITFICNKCKKAENGNVTLDIVKNPAYNEYKKYFVDRYKRITDKNFSEFLSKDIDEDELDLDIFEKLKKEVKNNVCSFNFLKEVKCQSCGTKNYIDLSNINFCVKCLSEDSIRNFFQTYNDMIYYGHYTKSDIDSMYPFERKILRDILSKTLEDINKQKQQQLDARRAYEQRLLKGRR